MQLYLKKFWSDNQGQDTVEYALVTSLVALAAVGAMPPLRATLSTVFSKIVTIVDSIH